MERLRRDCNEPNAADTADSMVEFADLAIPVDLSTEPIIFVLDPEDHGLREQIKNRIEAGQLVVVSYDLKTGDNGNVYAVNIRLPDDEPL